MFQKQYYSKHLSDSKKLWKYDVQLILTKKRNLFSWHFIPLLTNLLNSGPCRKGFPHALLPYHAWPPSLFSWSSLARIPASAPPYPANPCHLSGLSLHPRPYPACCTAYLGYPCNLRSYPACCATPGVILKSLHVVVPLATCPIPLHGVGRLWLGCLQPRPHPQPCMQRSLSLSVPPISFYLHATTWRRTRAETPADAWRNLMHVFTRRLPIRWPLLLHAS
jgi:hypothetical protein